MHLPDDTIAALSTPPGRSGIAIVRMSGPEAIRISDRIFSAPRGRRPSELDTHSVIHGFILDPRDGSRMDEVLLTIMRAPATYTREDIVEINCHGGMVPLRRILELLLREGARLAEPGEFTKRAFLNGRIDLSQAEAVIDIISAGSEQAERLALEQLEGKLSQTVTGLRDEVAQLCAMVEASLDFPDEEVPAPDNAVLREGMEGIRKRLAVLSESFSEGRLYREGAGMAVVGKPNVGKSSLLNALLQKDRAIVTELPGTTRDVIEESLVIDGIPVRIMDTAGIREAHDLAEAEGVKRSLKAIEGADLVLAVFDAGKPLDEADREVMGKLAGRTVITVFNKSDIAQSASVTGEAIRHSGPLVFVSAKTGSGLDMLKSEIVRVLRSGGANVSERETSAGVILTNVRHKQLVDKAMEALAGAEEAYSASQPLEVIALFLRETLDSLGEIVGAVTTEDILDRIFSRFCIGK